MKDFKVGKTPALDAHVLSHDGEAFGFDLPDMTSALRMRITPTGGALKHSEEHFAPITPSGPLWLKADIAIKRRHVSF